MKNRNKKIINYILLFFLSIAILAVAASNIIKINFIAGDIKIKRNDTFIKLNVGDLVNSGDIFKLSKKSNLVLIINNSELLKVRGPKIFLFNEKSISKHLNNSNIWTTLFKKISSNTLPFYPKTVVSAVRGKADYEKMKKLNEESKLKIEKAIQLFNDAKYDEAKLLFNELLKINSLRKPARATIKFYIAEIFFQEMKFTQALVLYKDIYNYKSNKFINQEESHIRLIICAEYTGNHKLMVKLINDYKEFYSKNGKYMKYINNIEL